METKGSSVVGRLLRFTRPYLGYLILALVSAVIQISMTLLAPVLIGDAIMRLPGYD